MFKMFTYHFRNFEVFIKPILDSWIENHFPFTSLPLLLLQTVRIYVSGVILSILDFTFHFTLMTAIWYNCNYHSNFIYEEIKLQIVFSWEFYRIISEFTCNSFSFCVHILPNILLKGWLQMIEKRPSRNSILCISKLLKKNIHYKPGFWLIIWFQWWCTIFWNKVHFFFFVKKPSIFKETITSRLQTEIL